jgi:hypothetical protein
MQRTSYIDFGPYLRPPRIGASSGLLLSIRLLGAAPKKPEPRVYTALVGVRDAAEELQAVLRERQRFSGFNLRIYDRDFDGAWGAIHARVHAHTRYLKAPTRERAGALLEALFPEGLVFLTARCEEEWVYSRTLLQRIEGEGYEDELEELAGEDFLAHVREAHEALGQALGLDEHKKDEDEDEGEGDGDGPLPLAPVLTRLAHAIANYGRVLAGVVDFDDPESVAMFETAMAPRDAHTARQRAGKSAAEDEGEEQADVEAEEQELLEQIDNPLPPVPEPSSEPGEDNEG